MATKRIMKELNMLSKDPPPGVSASPVDKDIFHLQGFIRGPKDSPYENGMFKLDIVFPIEYPFKPPKIKFVTKIFHPNISSTGSICLSILKDEWSACLKIGDVLLSIISLLTDPNPDDPLRPDLATLYTTNIDAFNKQARAETLQYAN